MIRLETQTRPVELTDTYVAEFTEKIKNGTSTWKNLNAKIKAVIKEALVTMSDSKCAYCERRINKEGHMHIEHFDPKGIYPDSVLLWRNLLPSCHRCNSDNKREHDTKIHPIIHPVRDVPKEHIRLYHGLFKTQTDLGRTTIMVLDLNNDDLQSDRYKIGREVVKQIDNLARELDENPVKAQETRNRLRAIMKLCTPSAVFAATTSAALLNDPDYHKIKNFLQSQSLWNESFESLEEKIQYCALDLANRGMAYT